MATEKEMFEVEVGNYLRVVSPQTPVGVCERCMSMRLRSEVQSAQHCPASIIEDAWTATSSRHVWKRFTDRAELESYLKTNFGRYHVLLRDVERWVADQAAAAQA